MNFPSVIRSFDLRHLGMCRRCMRISFAAMAVSWLLFGGALWLYPAAALFAAAAPVALTAVWIGHIVARSTRSVRSELPRNYSRRLAIRTAVMAVAAAAATSVASNKAHADGLSPCGGWGGGPESGCRRCPNNCYRQNDECSCVRCATCCGGGQEC